MQTFHLASCMSEEKMAILKVAEKVTNAHTGN